eukprot:3954324-Karenia_brevis.AAC.1
MKAVPARQWHGISMAAGWHQDHRGGTGMKPACAWHGPFAVKAMLQHVSVTHSTWHQHDISFAHMALGQQWVGSSMAPAWHWDGTA